MTQNVKATEELKGKSLVSLYAGRPCTGRGFFLLCKLKNLTCNLGCNMDVLTVLNGCDLSFGFGIWKQTEVVTEMMVLLDS